MILEIITENINSLIYAIGKFDLKYSVIVMEDQDVKD